MKARVAVIAPYADLKLESEAAVEELGIDVLVEEGDLAEGVRAARRAVAGGAEVIVSRGGTALQISRALNVPVVEIEVSPYDILRCLYQIREYKGVIGITGFRNVVYGCESLGNMLGMKIRQIVVDSRGDALEKITAAARAGVGMIIGDAVSVKLASKLGIEGMLVASGKEAVAKAIGEAQKIAEVRIRERERSEILSVVIDNSHDGIVAIDREERITLFNPAAERIFGVKASDAIGKPVARIIPNTELPRVMKEGRSEYGALHSFKDKVIVTHRLVFKLKDSPIAAMANFKDVTELQRLERLVRQKMHTKGFIARTSLGDLVGESPCMLHVKERAGKFAAVDAAVLISGETGTGRTGPSSPSTAPPCPKACWRASSSGMRKGRSPGRRREGSRGSSSWRTGGPSSWTRSGRCR